VAESQTADYTRFFQNAVKAAGMDHVEFLYLDEETHGSLSRRLGRPEPDGPRQPIIDWIRKTAGKP
jgi:hypothetical protein